MADQKAPALLRPFTVGSRETDKQTYIESANLSSSSQPLRPYFLDPIGYVGCLYVNVTIASSGNSANVTAGQNAPFAVLSDLTLKDINSKPIGGPMNGWDWYIVAKYGGYTFSDDAKSYTASTYSAISTGNGGTAGSGSFCLRIPVAWIRRSALGALTNKNAGALLTLEPTLSAVGANYGTAPNGTVAVTVEIAIFGWMDAATDDGRSNPVRQNPPALDSTQFWYKQSYPVNSGEFITRLSGVDGPVRNIIWSLVDSNGSRSQGDSDFPTTTTILFENIQPVQRRKTLWRHLINEYYGYDATVETAKGRDYGVYPWPFILDFGLKAGAESGFGYLPATTQTNLTIQGSIGGSGAHTLYVYVNKLWPVGGNPLMLTGGR